eukprot:SAG31_NODE_5355_length_2591_cov_2.022472_4_plen_101_part_00
MVLQCSSEDRRTRDAKRQRAIAMLPASRFVLFDIVCNTRTTRPLFVLHLRFSRSCNEDNVPQVFACVGEGSGATNVDHMQPWPSVYLWLILVLFCGHAPL